ncbi:MAG: hypothetical protein CBD62_00860 [Candidatus Pelagibacter sp. TMED202]|nr:MAG: hypothetical protein CBD62_00860 [Candidatus Pelagibacter sp. TMED202]
MITIEDAIKSLHPTAKFVVINEKITEWHSDDITQPTDEEINTEQERLQAEYDGNEYQRNRADEYPDIGDQLDYIYHNGLTKWKSDMIKPVKDKYPKE